MIMTLKFSVALVALAFTTGPLTLPHTGLDADLVPLSGLTDTAMVTIASGTLRYRPAGEFIRAGKPANAPIVTVRMRRPLTIMRRQVTAAEYSACVADGACAAVSLGEAANAALPVVKVNWRDATAYAAWASRKSGQKFRLPTDEEWAFAAGSRWRDDPLLASDANDPSKRWIARYEAEANREDMAKEVRLAGAFGINEHGLADMAGNVWEWTDSCYKRVTLDQAGEELGKPNVNCGVRVVVGRHRTYMTDFIRDPRNGGCALGLPPSNLGFRLVRDDQRLLIW